MIIVLGNDTACQQGAEILYQDYPDDVLIQPTATQLVNLSKTLLSTDTTVETKSAEINLFELSEHKVERLKPKILRNLFMNEKGALIQEHGGLPTRLTFLGHSIGHKFPPFNSPAAFVDYFIKQINTAAQYNPRILDTVDTIDFISCQTGFHNGDKSFAQLVEEGLRQHGFIIQVNAISNAAIKSEIAAKEIYVNIIKNISGKYSKHYFHLETVKDNEMKIHRRIDNIRDYLDVNYTTSFEEKTEKTPFFKCCEVIESHINRELLKDHSMDNDEVMRRLPFANARKALRKIKKSSPSLEAGIFMLESWLNNIKGRDFFPTLVNGIKNVIKAAKAHQQKALVDTQNAVKAVRFKK